MCRSLEISPEVEVRVFLGCVYVGGWGWRDRDQWRVRT